MKTIWPEGIRTVAMTAEPRTGRMFERRRRLGRCWFKVKFVVISTPPPLHARPTAAGRQIPAEHLEGVHVRLPSQVIQRLHPGSLLLPPGLPGGRADPVLLRHASSRSMSSSGG